MNWKPNRNIRIRVYVIFGLAISLALLNVFTTTSDPNTYSRDMELRMLLFAPGCLLFLVISVWHLIFMFTGWKRHHLAALLPFAAIIVAFLMADSLASTLLNYMLKGTIYRPDSFLTETTRHQLDRVASQLLETHIKSITLHPDEPMEVKPLAGYPKTEPPPSVIDTLREYGFRSVFVDRVRAIVVFGHYRPRSWYEYIYSRNPLGEPFASSPEITEVDINSWDGLLHFAQLGDVGPDFKPPRLHSCSPHLVYSHLAKTIGTNALVRIATYSSSSQLTENEKQLVIEALNEHLLPTSPVVEDETIRYGPWRWKNESRYGLNICQAVEISDGFWPIALLEQLLKDGVLATIDEEGHLAIKKKLTEDELHQVMWVNAGLMRFVYGGLVHKHQHAYRRKLAEHWYFNID